MEIELSPETLQFQESVRTWSAARSHWPRDGHVFDQARWAETVALGVIEAETNGGTLLDTVVGFIELARVGMPGPLLEAHLAVQAAPEVAELIARGEVVTSVLPTDGSDVVGWGNRADLIVDQRTGARLAEGPLPPAQLTYELPHGWLHDVVAGEATDPLTARRWTVGAALLVGLAQAAIEQAGEYAKMRVQFGKPIGAFYAVQERLVEALLATKAAQLAVVDTAWRQVSGQSHALNSAAVAWLGAARASVIADKCCHQVLGATGFTLETGLEGLTWPAWWLRRSVGMEGASTLLRSRLIATPGATTNVYESVRS